MKNVVRGVPSVLAKWAAERDSCTGVRLSHGRDCSHKSRIAGADDQKAKRKQEKIRAGAMESC